MLLIFLLLLVNSFEVFSTAEVETLCTTNACFTLHMVRRNFENASQTCIHNGGYLMTIRDTEEEDVLRSLLSKIPKQHETPKVWIGLKLKRGDCVLANKTLRGFKWVSGEENSHYSNWKKEPVITCIEERCVMAHHTLTGEKRLKWIDRGCKTTAFYACKFYFMGMCKPLALLGPGQITYTAAFSEKPQRTDMKLFPLGTYAEILCDDQQFHQSVCTGTDNTYKWNVPGPFCNTGKQSCTINNGGCEHLCHEDEDEVQCFCKEGYELDEDGLTCRIKDLCSDNICEYRCVMSVDESGYSCKCPVGFQLDANQHNCSDIDECESENCDHHFCLNTHGSYTCACKDGYEMVDGKCRDVDECARLRCDHSCLNSIGSFSCHCNQGFALSEDGHSCADIDECVSNRCQFKCINTVGSFLCICLPGFQVEANGSCTVHMTATSATSSDEAAERETQENFTEESLTRTTVELQHQSPHTDTPLPVLVNITHRDRQGNASLVTSFTNTVNSRVLICVLGSVIPLLLLVIVTLAIAIFRCSSSKKEAKKNTTTDGYCWVSSGLDPRLEKLYESILTDDL